MPSPQPARPATGTDSSRLLLVGGGLQNALIALATLHRNPSARLCVVEREARFGGNHTWCFHSADVPSTARPWLEPLVVQRWPGYIVKFPRYVRRVDQVYSAISSEQLHAVLAERLELANAECVVGTATQVDNTGATLSDGTRLGAGSVVDARGPEGTTLEARHFQKFIGLELRVAKGSAPTLPTLMDATVQQRDGFRFMYVLPFAEDRVLVEDTTYSDSPELDDAVSRRDILDYAAQQGLVVRDCVREERGVLPLPTTALPTRPKASAVLRAGYGGGYFHPTTGYSLPVAVRLAEHVAQRWPAPLLDADFQQFFTQHQKQFRYCLWLNRLLFGGFAPERRYEVLARFYQLPAATIGRFYALNMTGLDRARILCGRPPRGFSAHRLLFARGHHA